MRETVLQSKCNKTLRQLNIPFIHVPSRAAKMCNTLKHWPDLIILYKNKIFGIELKSKGGSLSKGQKDMFEILHSHGMQIRICFDYDQFINVLTEFGIVR